MSSCDSDADLTDAVWNDLSESSGRVASSSLLYAISALAAAACGTCATCVRTATPAIANAHKSAQMHSLRFPLHVSLLTPCTYDGF